MCPRILAVATRKKARMIGAGGPDSSGHPHTATGARTPSERLMKHTHITQLYEVPE